MIKLLFIFTLLLYLPFAHANEAEFQRGFDAYDASDYKTAYKIWKPLAEQGHGFSQYYIGLIYADGKGVIQNYTEALKWYRKGAKQGNTPAQINLGFMYEFGRAGLKKSTIHAYMWYIIGKSNNEIKEAEEPIENVLQGIEKLMSNSDIEKAQNLAKQCFNSNYKDCPK